jgi:hypothetical protein
MDIFIRGIPRQASNEEVHAKLSPHLFRYKIQQFQCHKPKNKGYAKLYINDSVQGQAFLAEYATRTDVRLSFNFHFTFELSHHQDGGASLRDEISREQGVPHVQETLEQAFSSKLHRMLAYESTDGIFKQLWQFRTTMHMYMRQPHFRVATGITNLVRPYSSLTTLRPKLAPESFSSANLQQSYYFTLRTTRTSGHTASTLPGTA